jgi:HEAT repeats/Cysteine-rich secretory protein family
MLIHLLVALIVGFSDSDKELAALLSAARGKDSVARLAAYDTLSKSDVGKKALLSVLRDAEDRAAREFLALPKSGEAAEFRRWLIAEVGSAREAALAVIRDGKVYPDEAHGVVGQPIVDDKVARLREMWLRPSRFFAERVDAVNVRLYYIKEASDWLKRIGAAPERFRNKEEALAELDDVFDVRELLYDKGELAKIDAVNEENATGLSVATDEERRFARILNDYRVMLGLEPLRQTDPLVLASRKHSQEMQDLNYFAHESPVAKNRTPGDRARQEGHTGGVLENCAISGDAQAAFDGWYNSSGHHRGLISAGARLLGAGQSILGGGGQGRHWTMLAGPGSAPKPKGAKKEPRDVLAERRAKLREGDAETRVALAKYCRKHELLDDERRLYEEVIAIDSEHKVARRALGHVRADGKWMTPEEKLAHDLATLPKAEVIAAAAARLGDPDAVVRLAAVRTLANVGDPAALPNLVKALGDKASEVRLEACRAVRGAPASSVAAPLAKLLGDESFYVAHQAAVVLLELGDRRGIPTLFASLRSPDLNHRIDAHKQARAAFGEDFGYAWDLPDAERAKVVDRWESWVTETFGS